MLQNVRIAIQSLPFAMALTFVGICMASCSNLTIWGFMPLPAIAALFSAAIILLAYKALLLKQFCKYTRASFFGIAISTFFAVVGAYLYFFSSAWEIQLIGFFVADAAESIFLFFTFRIACSYIRKNRTIYLCCGVLLFGALFLIGCFLPKAILPYYALLLCATGGAVTFYQYCFAPDPKPEDRSTLYDLKQNLDASFHIPTRAIFTTGFTGFLWASALFALLNCGYSAFPLFSFIGLAIILGTAFTLISRIFIPALDESSQLKSFAIVSFFLFVLYPTASAEVRFAVSLLTLAALSNHIGSCLIAIVETTRFNQILRDHSYGRSIPSLLLGAGIGTLLFTCPQLFLSKYEFFICCCAVFFIILILSAYFFKSSYPENPNESSIVIINDSQDTPTNSEAYKTKRRDRIDQIVKEYGLTIRQREVFEMLLKGRNAQYISDEFVISHSTVKAHIHNIYTKLDVHSQQELISLFEETTSPKDNEH